MGATSSLCSGSKSVQVVNSTDRRPSERQAPELPPLYKSSTNNTTQDSGFTEGEQWNRAKHGNTEEREHLNRNSQHGLSLTESEVRWKQTTDNNNTNGFNVMNAREGDITAGNVEIPDSVEVDRRQNGSNRRKDDGCNLSVYDNVPGNHGKHSIWEDNLQLEAPLLVGNAYLAQGSSSRVAEYVDGLLVNQNTGLNFSDTSLVRSESCDSWHIDGKAQEKPGPHSNSSSQSSVPNPSLDNGNRSDLDTNSKNNAEIIRAHKTSKSASKDSLPNLDYDNLPPTGMLRPSQSDSGNLCVIGEVKEFNFSSPTNRVGSSRQPRHVGSAKGVRSTKKVNNLRHVKSLTLPLTQGSRPKSARRRDSSRSRDVFRNAEEYPRMDAHSSSTSDSDDVLSIPDETRRAGAGFDELSDGLSNLGSSPDHTFEALDSFSENTAPTPRNGVQSGQLKRPPSFDIVAVLDDNVDSKIGKKGSERSISSIIITPMGEGRDSANARLRTLSPSTSLDEVGAMIAGDIIYRRSQGAMTQTEYQSIVKAYRIILEQLLAYQQGKEPPTTGAGEKTTQIGKERENTKAKEADESEGVVGSPMDEGGSSSSDFEEKLQEVTEVFEQEFAQKLVERGNGLTEADITRYLTEHAQNVTSVKSVLESQKAKHKPNVDVEVQDMAISQHQPRKLAMLEEVARLLYIYSTDTGAEQKLRLEDLCEAILESVVCTPAEIAEEPDTMEKEVSEFGKDVDNAMYQLNEIFIQLVTDRRNDATAEELSHIIEKHLIEETAMVKRFESDRVKRINDVLKSMGKTQAGFHVKVSDLDGNPDDMNKKRRKLEQALKRILLGRKPIGEDEISNILDKYRREQRAVIEKRDTDRLKRRDELKQKLVLPPISKPTPKPDLNEIRRKYDALIPKSKDKVAVAFHTMTAQKILESQEKSKLSKNILTQFIQEHQRRVAELKNVRQRQIESALDSVARDKAEDEKRSRERRAALNRATGVKDRAEDVLASYRDATLQLHSLKPISPQHHEDERDVRRKKDKQTIEDHMPDSGYVEGLSVDTSLTTTMVTGTPISSPGVDYTSIWNGVSLRKVSTAESVRAEDYESLELVVNAVIDHCVDDYSRAEKLYSWLVSQEIPASAEGEHDDESPMFALNRITKGHSSHADLYLEMARLAGLTCEKVEGHTKSPDYSPGEDLFSNMFRHSWNAVFIDNRYFLLDSSEGSRREKFFREHFFCTGPSIYALTHFPDNQRWQLMEREVTKEDFANALKVWPAMFVYDIRPLNSKCLIRTYDGKLCITFSVKHHSVLCHMEYAGPGQHLDPKALAYNIDQHTNNVENEEAFHIALPLEGVYFFTLLVNDPEDEIDLPVCQYRIDYQDELL